MVFDPTLASVLGAAFALLVFAYLKMAADINYDRAKDPAINDTPMNMQWKGGEETTAFPSPGTKVIGEHAIIVADTGSNFVEVEGDHTLAFIAGVIFEIVRSSGNDGTFTVLSSALVSGNTQITVASIVDATPDGAVVQGDSAKVNLVLTADADETGSADVQDLFRIDAVPTIAPDGKIDVTFVVTPVLGDGTDGVPQTKVFRHDENMDAWQTAAGRPRQV